MGFVGGSFAAAETRTVRLFESQSGWSVADLRRWPTRCSEMAVERWGRVRDLQLLADSIAWFAAKRHFPDSEPFDLDSLSIKKESEIKIN